MKTLRSLTMLAGIAFLPSPASADILPSGVISAQADGANYDYIVTLANSGASTSPIGTFWFAWTPGQDYLPTSPLSINTPDGWKVAVTHRTSSPDGYALQWVALSVAAEVAPGTSLNFGFTSADDPTQIAGDSPFYPATPVGTSVVYPGAPFSDAGHDFVVQSVPEPSSLILACCGGMTAMGISRLRRRRRAV